MNEEDGEEGGFSVDVMGQESRCVNRPTNTPQGCRSRQAYQKCCSGRGARCTCWNQCGGTTCSSEVDEEIDGSIDNDLSDLVVKASQDLIGAEEKKMVNPEGMTNESTGQLKGDESSGMNEEDGEEGGFSVDVMGQESRCVQRATNTPQGCNTGSAYKKCCSGYGARCRCWNQCGGTTCRGEEDKEDGPVSGYMRIALE